MSRDLTSLATRYAGRPLLIAPRQAEEIARRIQGVDHQAFTRPSRLGAVLRRVSGGRGRPTAMEGGDEHEAVPFEERAAYSPHFIGEPDGSGFCWTLKDGVALLQADTALGARGEAYCGVFYHGYDTLLIGLREAMADDRVKAVFLRLDSPGGVVAGGLPALAAFMRGARAAAGGKPIWVYADMAASAAYWIAAQADRIVAPRVGLVGSLGAVMVLEDWSAALDKAGLRIESIEFPENGFKTEGAWWKALSDEGRKLLLAEIAQCGRDFFADVVAGRPQLTVEKLTATRANVFMAHHDDPALSGLALGLVDAIGDEEATFAELRDLVAGPANLSTPATGTPSADAPRGRASASPAQEASMAQNPEAGGKPSAAAAALTQAQAAVERANAELTRAEAAAAEEGQAPADQDEDKVDPPTAAADQPADGEDEKTDDEDGPAAIAASAEAKIHPGLALAAIQSGQSLAQFRANVAAAGPNANGGRNLLKATLAGSPRVGADAVPSGGKKPRSAAADYARNTAAGRKANAV